MIEYHHDSKALGLARAAALAIAEIAGWAVDASANRLLDRRLADYIVAPDGWAMLAPYAGASSLGLGGVARAATRSDVLLVAVAPDHAVRVVIGRSNRRDWGMGYQLWQSESAELWFAPELADGRSYRVMPTGLKDRPAPPWRFIRERDEGFARAALLIAERLTSA